MAGGQSSRSRTTRNKGAATKAAAKKERARRHTETSKDLSRAGDGSQECPSREGEHAEPAALESLSLYGIPDQLNKHLNKQKEFIQGLMESLKESLDNMPAELNQQGELTAGLVMLLKNSIASDKKATGEILRLQEDKAKLYHEIDLLKEKNAGWKKLHENSSSSMKMLQALVMEQKEDLVKLRIEHSAVVQVRSAVVEQMMKARVEKSHVMDRLKNMAEETRKEMEVVEEMKMQLRLRGELDHLG